MAQVEIRGLQELIAGIRDLQRNQLPFAMAKTLTKLAEYGKDNAVKEMQSMFDRPTPFTLNSLKVNAATKTNLVSADVLKDPSRRQDEHHYINPAIVGGGRWFKAFEVKLFKMGVLPAGFFAVPASSFDLDLYGNFSRSKLNEILAYFDANPPTSNRRNLGALGRAKKAKGTARRYGTSYFVVNPGQATKMAPGIYQSISSNFGRAVKLVFLFTRSTRYKIKLDLLRITKKTYDDHFTTVFNSEYTAAVSTALNR